MRKTIIFILSAASLLVAGAALGATSHHHRGSHAYTADQKSGPPTIDLQKVCRASAQQTGDIFGTEQSAFNSCIDDEKQARAQLVKDWATLPASVKAFCIQPDEYLPSYVEWQTCSQMTSEVTQARKEAPASDTGGSNTRRRSSRSKAADCPIVQWNQDGTISSMIAC